MKHYVFIWFKQKRMEGTPITKPILCEKAIHMNMYMYLQNTVRSYNNYIQHACITTVHMHISLFHLSKLFTYLNNFL